MSWVFEKHFTKADRIFLVHRQGMAGNGTVVKAEMPYPFATAVKKEVPDVKYISRVINTQAWFFF